MPFEYIGLEEAKQRSGLRMIVISNVPSVWGEAAKGIFHIKGIDWAAVRLDLRDREMSEWAGQRSGPIAIYNDEKPRSGWSEILHLAERIQPEPSLIPRDPFERAVMFGLAHELCAEKGLAWERRLEMIDLGGFGEKGGQYLGRKYGYHTPEDGKNARSKVVTLLKFFSDRLKEQKSAGSRFYVGNTVTAADVYSATSMAMFAPLPEEQCKMDEGLRYGFGGLHEDVAHALDPILLEHRDMMYQEYLELPLSL